MSIFAEAQQPSKIPRIGFLRPGSASGNPATRLAFQQGLRDLGYIEGKNIAIEYRYADLKPDRLAELAAELVSLKPDVIVTSQTPSVLAIKRTSATIPIVFAVLSFPVENGIVESFARPGGNATGLTVLSEQLNGKRLELLKDTVPNLARAAVLSNPANPTQPLEWKEIQVTAHALGLKLQSVEIKSFSDFDSAFAAVLSNRAQALINLPENLINSHFNRIDFAATKAENSARHPPPRSGSFSLCYSQTSTAESSKSKTKK